MNERGNALSKNKRMKTMFSKFFFKIGSFNCDLTSCKEGYANWRQTEGNFRDRILCPKMVHAVVGSSAGSITISKE